MTAMMSETERAVAGFVTTMIAVVAFTAMGTAVGYDTGKKDGLAKATQASVVMCIKKPKKCRILYDYYAVREFSDESKSGQ